jgi:DNA-binding CsgD family transcriptional regulator
MSTTSFPDRLRAIERALREALEPLIPRMARQVAEQIQEEGPPKALPKACPLTLRQLEYTYWACHEDHYTRERIAGFLDISVAGVDKLSDAVYKKLGVHNRIELMNVVRKCGLLDGTGAEGDRSPWPAV